MLGLHCYVIASVSEAIELITELWIIFRDILSLRFMLKETLRSHFLSELGF